MRLGPCNGLKNPALFHSLPHSLPHSRACTIGDLYVLYCIILAARCLFFFYYGYCAVLKLLADLDLLFHVHYYGGAGSFGLGGPTSCLSYLVPTSSYLNLLQVRYSAVPGTTHLRWLHGHLHLYAIKIVLPFPVVPFRQIQQATLSALIGLDGMALQTIPSPVHSPPNRILSTARHCAASITATAASVSWCLDCLGRRYQSRTSLVRLI